MKAELIDSMGNDLTVVNSARVSFDKQSGWTKPSEGNNLSEKDKKLISYLARHNHWTPFSHPQITMRETVPIFVARQRFKHMVGFTYNEISRRYVDKEPEFYFPSKWRSRPDGSVKQGSGDDLEKSLEIEINGRLGYIYQDIHDLYFDMIDQGVAPEQARMILPQSMYTSYYVTGSLAAWARAYTQRIDKQSQKEIQELAKEWANIIEPLFPESWKCLTG